MRDGNVTRRVRVLCDHERDLDRRIELFVDAVNRRQGRILDIEWHDQDENARPAATIRFELPSVWLSARRPQVAEEGGGGPR